MPHITAFDPPPAEVAALLDRFGALVAELVTTAASRDVLGNATGTELAAALLDDLPSDEGADLDAVVEKLREVLATGVDNAAPGELAYIPGSGLLVAALGDLVASTANRYTGLGGFSPAAVALEQSVLRWLTELFALPDQAQAVLLAGGSAANLSALVAARERHAPGAVHRATVYVGQHAHASVRKAARIAGIDAAHVRRCESDGLRLSAESVRLAIKDDVAAGLLPTAIVAAAGTTNAGAVDPLAALADVAADLGVWFHVDAAYGGFFQLTERGRRLLTGIERADSITLDPHKSLFLPFGTGALLVRDRSSLALAFAEDADYLRDHSDDADLLPDFAAITPELTRPWRGLRLWLALKLHGVAAFRRALDGALDLAADAAHRLAADPAIEVLGEPDLSIVTFRVRGDDKAQDRLVADVHRDGRVRLSTTVIDGEVVLRLAVLSHRTSAETIDDAVELIHAAAVRITQA